MLSPNRATPRTWARGMLGFGDGVVAMAGAGHDGCMDFEVVGEITDVETIATGTSIRELPRLQRAHGIGRWRKRKGVARVRLADGFECRAEIHWYEAHGIGQKELKIKRILGD